MSKRKTYCKKTRLLYSPPAFPEEPLIKTVPESLKNFAASRVARACLTFDFLQHVIISNCSAARLPSSKSNGTGSITSLHLYPGLTCIDAFDNRWIKSSVVQLFSLYPSMGPEVAWDSQVKKKNPGDAVVAWENKRLSTQLKGRRLVGCQVGTRRAAHPSRVHLEVRRVFQELIG